MQLESRKLLHDMLEAIEQLQRFSSGKSFEDYESDSMFSSAVERKFEVIDEAPRRLARTDAESAKSIPDYGRIIAFRNILTHGYAQVDNRLVWDVLVTRVDPLAVAIRSLLDRDP
jgi:uncharacterized protein with HEPN domain